MLLADKVREISNNLNITDVVSKYIDIFKEGQSAICDCPFCKEQDRMIISDEKGFYKCYSCKEEGDVADFVARYEHISKRKACEQLCKDNNIPFDVEISNEERNMYAAVSKSAKYFHQMLKGDATATSYLIERGLTPLTIKKFAIGYADAKWTSLRDALKRDGVTEDTMKQAGLISVNLKTNNTYDKFTDRIMFPIINENNDVVGFSGRLFRETDKRDSKYFNSPASDIFKKNSVLFGINYAVKSDKKAWILCEGQMDVITSHQSGYDSTVASLGTALTKEHANLIRQYTKTVYLAYDADDAGIKATMRNIPILRNAGLNVKVIDLSPYKDPDELLKNEGNDYYNQKIMEAINSYDYEVTQWVNNKEELQEKFTKVILNSSYNDVYSYLESYEKIYGSEFVPSLNKEEKLTDVMDINEEIEL